MKKSDYEGVDPAVRELTLRMLRKQNEHSALDALKRAANAASQELYQLEIDNAVRYIRDAMRNEDVNDWNV